MLTLNIKNELFEIKDISKETLIDVLSLYNNTDNFLYATGRDKAMTIDDMNQKYYEALVNIREFFAGLYLDGCSELIGVIRGRIDYDNNSDAWINSLLIKTSYQRKGYGREFLNIILNYFKESYGVTSVNTGIISGNQNGIGFWQSIGFKQNRTIEKYIKFDDCIMDFIIMKKET